MDPYTKQVYTIVLLYNYIGSEKVILFFAVFRIRHDIFSVGGVLQHGLLSSILICVFLSDQCGAVNYDS